MEEGIFHVRRHQPNEEECLHTCVCPIRQTDTFDLIDISLGARIPLKKETTVLGVSTVNHL